jgi:hypothetical protein
MFREDVIKKRMRSAEPLQAASTTKWNASAYRVISKSAGLMKLERSVAGKPAKGLHRLTLPQPNDVDQ